MCQFESYERIKRMTRCVSSTHAHPPLSVAPTDAEVDLLKERSRRRALALAGSNGEGATYDGYRVKLLANIGTVDDAMKASKFDLEGSGLFRARGTSVL